MVPRHRARRRRLALVSHYTVVTGIEVDTDIRLEADAGEQESLDPERESALYRVAQEALTNIAKHARAERAELTVREDDEQLELVIWDDGIGFDPRKPSHEGFGLISMEERISLGGGELAVTSVPGSGTEVRAVLPLRRSPRSAAERQSA